MFSPCPQTHMGVLGLLTCNSIQCVLVIFVPKTQQENGGAMAEFVIQRGNN